MEQRVSSGPAELPSAVGQTAIGVARARALESRRPDRLFDDPLAAAFVEAAGADFNSPASSSSMDVRPMRDAYVAIRTRFFDEALLGASNDSIRQVVIPGAGLDVRAFRLPWHGDVSVFELDVPDVFEFKERVLAEHGATPRCERIVVPSDLRQDWPTALRSSGFRADQASVWLLEGVLMYLTQVERDLLIGRISRLADSASRMAAEPPTWRIPADVAATVARGTLDQATMALAAQLSQAAGEEPSVADPAGWLSGWGWRVQLYDVAERFAAYGRQPTPGVADLPGATRRRWLATAERAKA